MSEKLECDLGIFEVWDKETNKGVIRDKYPYALKYRGRIIDFAQSINEWQRVVEKNPRWLQDKVREIDSYLETASGKMDIKQGKAYPK